MTVCTRHMQTLAARLGFDSTVIPISVPATLLTDSGAEQAAPYVPNARRRTMAIAAHGTPQPRKGPSHAVACVRRHTTVACPRTWISPAATRWVDGCRPLREIWGVETHVTFHGVVPQDAVRTHCRAHLHVMSSRHEAACGLKPRPQGSPRR